MIHALATRCRANGGGMSEPYSLLLWWRGQRSGLILEVLGRRVGHIRSYASWELQCYLEADVAVGMRVTVY